MLEGVLRPRIERGLDDELRRTQPVERRAERCSGNIGNPLEHARGELPADHGRRLKDGLLPLAGAIDPGGENALHGRWKGDSLRGRDDAVAPLLTLEVPRLGERLDQLLGEE